MIESHVNRRIKRQYWKTVRGKYLRIKRRRKLDIVARDYAIHQLRVRTFREWKKYVKDTNK